MNESVTEPRPRIQAVRATGAMMVEHCDVPQDMTLCEWRRAKAASAQVAAPRRPLLKRVFGRSA